MIFNGIEDIENRFVEFYDNLSKFGLINNGGFKFDLPIPLQERITILFTLIDKDKELIRNSISAKIAPLIEKIFGEIYTDEREDDIDFIKSCFVYNEETKKNKSEIERLFADYAPKLNNVIPAINTESISVQIKDDINDDEIKLNQSYPPKPIIIIGSKGAGKTTFINHLFKYRFQNEDIGDHYPIYIDFRKFFQWTSNFEPDRIIDEIIEKIYDGYPDHELYSLKVLKRIYYTEIQRNDDSIWKYAKEHDEPLYNQLLSRFLDESKNKKTKHFELLSKYLIRERRKRLIIIIDNADQYDEPIQKSLFVFAHSLIKTALCGIVISLREGFYFRWHNSPPFDAYESNVYHISAPNYGEVLQKRIDFAIKKCTELHNKLRGPN